MRRWLDNRSVGAKLASNAIVIVLGLLLVGAAALVVSKHRMREDRMAELQAVVEVATSYANALAADVAKGELTQDQARSRFVALSNSTRYGTAGILIVYDENGKYVMNPLKPSDVGTDGTKLVDKSGRHFVQDAIDVVRRSGAGFYALDYPRPGETKPSAKLNFAKDVPALGIIVATGVYLVDLDEALLSQAEILGLVSLPILLLALGCSLAVRQSLASGLQRLSAAMIGLTKGDLSVVVPGVDRRDEVGGMAAAVQIFKDAAIETIRLGQDADELRLTREQDRARTEAERQSEAAKQAAVVEGLATALSQLSAGDLTCDMTEPFAPEFDRLRSDFNGAIAELRNVIGAIVSNTGALRSGTAEISQAADDLSRRTEQQAASLEQTAAALGLITATVRKTADGASSAQAVVATAKADAEQSSVIVRDAMSAMTAIEKSSQEIAQIIGVIDEIAFQTNLLALNAGVEAARAGDAGRGFAVVASEVRALAQRSAQAAKEIKALISTSTSQVGLGVTLVSETGTALGRILSQVIRIDGVVTEIAASAHEQASGLAEVNTAISHMDQVTQQNAAMVEESTAASHKLSQETAELEGLTERFKVGRKRPAPIAMRGKTSRNPIPPAASGLVQRVANGGTVRASETTKSAM